MVRVLGEEKKKFLNRRGKKKQNKQNKRKKKMSLKGKVAVVVGASGVVGSGIGLLFYPRKISLPFCKSDSFQHQAAGLAEQGAHVAVIFRGENGLAELKGYFKGKENQLFVHHGQNTVEDLEKFRQAVVNKFKVKLFSDFSKAVDFTKETHLIRWKKPVDQRKLTTCSLLSEATLKTGQCRLSTRRPSRESSKVSLSFPFFLFSEHFVWC